MSELYEIYFKLQLRKKFRWKMCLKHSNTEYRQCIYMKDLRLIRVKVCPPTFFPSDAKVNFTDGGTDQWPKPICIYLMFIKNCGLNTFISYFAWAVIVILGVSHFSKAQLISGCCCSRYFRIFFQLLYYRFSNA